MLLTARQVRIRFNGQALCVALLVFAVECLIATVGAPIALLRGLVGDVLAVVLVYYGLKTWVQSRVWPLAAVSLGIAYLVEFSQYLAKLNHWVIGNPLLRIIVGSTPDWWDVLAYTLGFGVILAMELVEFAWFDQARPIKQS